MAGVAFAVEGDGVGFSNQILRRISALHHARQPRRRRLGKVGEGRGGVRLCQRLRFPSPLIKPDVPISGIRLSDWFHR